MGWVIFASRHEFVHRVEVTGTHGIQEFVFGSIDSAASIVVGGHVETLAAGET